MALTRSSTDILLAFAPIPDAVRAARHALRERGLNPDLDHTVSLLTSELVGNAVRHAGPLNPSERIVFHARLSDDHVRVEVADHGPGFDPDIRHETGGFGLRLVEQFRLARVGALHLDIGLPGQAGQPDIGLRGLGDRRDAVDLGVRDGHGRVVDVDIDALDVAHLDAVEQHEAAASEAGG